MASGWPNPKLTEKTTRQTIYQTRSNAQRLARAGIVNSEGSMPPRDPVTTLIEWPSRCSVKPSYKAGPSSGVCTRSQKRKICEQGDGQEILELPSSGKKGRLCTKDEVQSRVASLAEESALTSEFQSHTPASCASVEKISTSYSQGLCSASLSAISGPSGFHNGAGSEVGVTCEEELDDAEGTDDMPACIQPLSQSPPTSYASHCSRPSVSSSSGRVVNVAEQDRWKFVPVFGLRPRESDNETLSHDAETYKNLITKEQRRCSAWGYLLDQTDLEKDHRSIMVNWLVEFSEEFKLRSETLFLGVAILDQYLKEGPPVMRSELQLLGLASILIAGKFEGSQPQNLLQECCLATDKHFSQEQVIQTEFKVLQALKYRCAISTVSTFTCYHLKWAGASLRLEKMGEFLGCLSLMDYDLLLYSPSVVSASAVLLAAHLLNEEPWTPALEASSGYAASDLLECVKALNEVHQRAWRDAAKYRLLAIKHKYGLAENLHVAWSSPKEKLPACLYKTPQVQSQQVLRG